MTAQLPFKAHEDCEAAEEAGEDVAEKVAEFGPPLRAARPRRAPLQLPRERVVADLISAVMCAGRHAQAHGWGLVEDGAAFSLDRHAATILLERRADIEPATDLDEIDALTLDALLVVLDRLVQHPEGAAVNARTVLEAKGYRRCGRERIAFEHKTLEHLRRLSRFKLRAANADQAFFEFAPRNVARTDFIVRPGAALAGGAIPRATLELPLSILEIDHRRNRGADPLAKKLAVLFAIAGPSPGESVCDLLARVGEPLCAESDVRRGRLAARFEAALARLAALGLYDIRPDLTFTRRKGWIQPWLMSRMAVAPRFQAEWADGGPPAMRADLPRPSPVRTADDWRLADPPRTRGRPRFAPTAEQRRLVQAMFARGRTREEIADRLQISLPTLRRYFAAELNAPAGAAPAVAAAHRAFTEFALIQEME